MRIMSLDCEFNQPSKKTIQIGAAIFDVRSGGDPIATLEIYVDPQEPIEPYITELTGITDDNVKGALTIKEAFQVLKNFHEEHQVFINPLVWGSGVRNDSSSLHEESGSEAPNFMGYRVIDAKTVYQSVQMFRNKKIKGGLKTACETLGIGFEGTAHTALADAINTFRIWNFMLRKAHEGFKQAEKLR